MTGWPAVGDRPLAVAALVAPPLSVVAPMGLTPLVAVVALVSLWRLVRGDVPLVFAAGRVAAVFALLVVWGAASAWWSIVPGDSLHAAAKLALLLLAVIALLAAARAGPGRQAPLLPRLLLAGYVLGLAVLAADLATGHAVNRGLRLLTGSDPTIGGGIVDRGVVVVLLAGFATVPVLSRWLPAAAAAAAPLPALALSLFANSESICLGGLIGYLGLLAVWLAGRRLLAAAGVVMVLLVIAMPLLPPGPLAPALWQERLAPVKYSAMHRLYIWEFVAARIAERPWAGWGLDGSPAIPGGDTPLPSGGVVLSLHPHNAPLQLWLELGMVGALLGAAVVALAVQAVLRLPAGLNQAAAAGPLFAGYVVACLSFGIWQSWWLVALGLAAALMTAAVRPAA